MTVRHAQGFQVRANSFLTLGVMSQVVLQLMSVVGGMSQVELQLMSLVIVMSTES